MVILAGDIGGTKTTLALCDTQGTILVDTTYPSQQAPDLVEIIHQFRSSLDILNVPIERACFGVAGPVQQGHAQPPNLSWAIDAGELAAELRLPSVRVINDLEATAYGINVLDPKDLLTLNSGQPDGVGNVAVIAAGTGLGEAGLVWNGKHHHPFACEGGHVDFAPGNRLQVRLLEYLMEKFDHVSWERVVSGPGIYNLYQFLVHQEIDEEPPWLAERLCQDDPASVITQAALVNQCPLCSYTLELFLALYGAAAGNLAMKFMATGGVFIGGGIAPRIFPYLETANFMKAFRDKGRMSSLLDAIPIHVILNPKTALLGAASCAAEHYEA